MFEIVMVHKNLFGIGNSFINLMVFTSHFAYFQTLKEIFLCLMTIDKSISLYLAYLNDI